MWSHLVMKRDSREATTITFSCWSGEDEWVTDRAVSAVSCSLSWQREVRVFLSLQEMGGRFLVLSPMKSSDSVHRADPLLRAVPRGARPAHPISIIITLISFPTYFCLIFIIIVVIGCNIYFVFNHLAALVYGISFYCGIIVGFSFLKSFTVLKWSQL